MTLPASVVARRSRIVARRRLAAAANRLASHVHTIAARHGITVGSHSSGGNGSSPDRHVNIRPVRSVATYAVAMHELGHVLARGRTLGSRLDQEATAWRWAIDHALPGTVNARWMASMHRSLDSYRRWVIRRGGGPGCPVMPPPDADFWTLLRMSQPPGVSCDDDGSRRSS